MKAEHASLKSLNGEFQVITQLFMAGQHWNITSDSGGLGREAGRSPVSILLPDNKGYVL